MSDVRRGARGPIPAWNGKGLYETFAARRDRPWTLGYASLAAPVIVGDAIWEGKFPAALTGTLFRNGPARHEFGGQRYGHRWDGDGMIQRFGLGASGVSHIGRYVQTRKFLDEEAAGRLLYSGFGTAVAKSAPTPEIIERSNPANVSVVPFNGELLALWEAGWPYRIDPASLATRGQVSWPRPGDAAPFSAHPKTGTDGTLWNFGIDPLQDRLYLYGFDRGGDLVTLHDLHVEQIAPAHDFGVTARYLVVLLPSITCNRSRLLAGTSFAESCQWTPQLGMRVIVVEKASGSRKELLLPSGVLFHLVNAWEEEDRVCVDYLRTADPSALLAGWSVMAGEYRHMRGAALTRATFDLRSGVARQETLIDHDAEFPSVLPSDAGRAYRQLLVLERSERRPRDVPGYDRLALIDAATLSRQTFNFGDDWMVEEHLLVADGDDGIAKWAIGTALDLAAKATVLSVFDVRNLAGGPVARARLPYALPLGLHGTFIHGGDREIPA